MKRLLFITKCFALALFCCLLLSGCFVENMDDLLSLPQQPAEHLQLQEQINEVLRSGASYAAPVSGSNRQSVQLVDIDGDGMNEALGFFSTSGEKPLKIVIFEIVMDEYQQVAVIEGDGTAIESVYYTDMNGDGVLELIVGWQMSTGLQMMEIYSMVQMQPAVLATVDYVEYTIVDLNSDGFNEVVVLHYSGAEEAGNVEVYDYDSIVQEMPEPDTAPLSLGIESLTRIKSGLLKSGEQALFIEGVCDTGEIITDIIAYRDSEISNVTMNRNAGMSTSTMRSYPIYSMDINDDGIIEVPRIDESKLAGDANYRIFDWYAYNSDSARERVMQTYHNYSDGWYFIMPTEWYGQVTIQKSGMSSNSSAVYFYLDASDSSGYGDPRNCLMTIYTYTGNNREEKASDKVILASSSSAVYALETGMSKDDWMYALDEYGIAANFRIIYSEWDTGIV